MIRTLNIRALHEVCLHRCKVRWKRKRHLQQYIDKVSDLLFDRSSARYKKNRDSGPTNEEDKENLKEALKKIKEDRKQRGKTVVFFGNGDFKSSMPGQLSTPKKKILHALCHRGMTVLLDEFNTSKMCPCGQSELMKASGRQRAHKQSINNNVTDCAFLKNSETKDRDVLAIINMALAAVCTLKGKQWPLHLRRDFTVGENVINN